MSVANSVRVDLRQRRPVRLGLTVAVAAVIAALAAADVSLEKTEQAEAAKSAKRADLNGRQLLNRGQPTEAVDAFRKAHALERDNAGYALDLIQALMAANKLPEAEPLMSEILEEESNDGEANLVAARLASKQGHINSADSYYHRAIYGDWHGQGAEHQIQVRMELIDFLTAHGKQDELLAELLPVEEEAAKDTSLQPKLARLFLAAGSPTRTEGIYRALIKREPRNGSYYAGLGEAELAMGDFRAAHNAFAAAVARDGNDPTWRARLSLATELSNLDPTARWLSAADKYSRSIQILQLATTDLQQCITNHPELATDDAKQLVSDAQAALTAQPPKDPTNEMAEGDLSLAERIWRSRTSLCGNSTAADEESLRLIMDKLAK